MIEIFKVGDEYLCSWCDDKIDPKTMFDHADSHLTTLKALRNIATTSFTFEAKKACYNCGDNHDCVVCDPDYYEDEGLDDENLRTWMEDGR